jgi:hypothetical protein
MRSFLKAALVMSLAVSGVAQAQDLSKVPPAKSPIDVYDGFETPTLSPLWDHDRFEEHAIAMESTVVRAGHQAVAITVRGKDMFETGQHGDLDSERDELREATPLTSRQNVPYEFSFSMFFPKDFPIVATRLVIAQVKQYCPPSTAACDDQSPVLALRYIGGVLIVSQDLEKKHIILFQKKDEFRGRWLDFRIRARFTPKADGHVTVWLNGEQLIDQHGATADQVGGATGYPDPSYFYFKMGLYRDVMTQPMTVYIDEYRKRELKADEF